MSKSLLHIIIITFLTTNAFYAQSLLEKSLTLKVDNVSIEEALEQIQHTQNIRFSYQGNLPGLRKKISAKFSDVPLQKALNTLLGNSNLTYQLYGSQIIIIEKIAENNKLIIQGQICEDSTKEPIPYATIELRKKKTGTIADHNGYFQLEITRESLNDTFYFSSLNYYSTKILASRLAEKGKHQVFLALRLYEMPEVHVYGKELKYSMKGNYKKFQRGSLYMDTHGQQTALYIDNADTLKGKIVKIHYFLSRKGNTDAPFRVHVYACDSVSGKPGIDLLPEMLVIKPNKGRGWYSINIARYNIDFPRNGFFVAMEGIFPNDYSFYYDSIEFKDITNDEEETSDGDFTPSSITYGQQLGYTWGNENNTWHYSIDHTWFQLKKRHFNVMIASEIRVEKAKRPRTFLHFFAKKAQGTRKTES